MNLGKRGRMPTILRQRANVEEHRTPKYPLSRKSAGCLMSRNKISFVPDFIHQHSVNPSSNHRTCRSFVLRRVFCICRCRCWFHKWDCCFGFRPQRRRKVDIRRTKSRNNWANNDRIWSRPRLVYIWAKEEIRHEQF